MERKWPFGRGGFGRTGEPARYYDNGKPTMNLARGQLTAAERGLLHHLERLHAAYPGHSAFSEADVWAQYSAYADRGRGHGLRESFDRALAGLAEHGLIDWRDGLVRIAP